MKEDEYDIFSKLDNEIGRDLSGWRSDIIACFEKCCTVAYDIEEVRTGAPLNLTDPSVRQAVRSHIIDFLTADWTDLEASPHPGDFISVTGESYWHTQGSDNDVPVLHKLPAGHKLQGTVAHWDIRPYVDQEGLELDVHTNPELISGHIGLFGVHLILDNPTLTDDAGALLPVRYSQAYVPIHYKQAKLKTYPIERNNI